MGNTVNDRVIDLLKTLNLDEIEVSRRIGKHPTTIYRIVNKETEPSKTTLKLIADALGANYNYLLTGKGDKTMRVNAADKEVSPPWKDEAYAILKDRVIKQDQMIQNLMSVLMGNKKVDFLKTLNEAIFPGSTENTLRVVRN